MKYLIAILLLFGLASTAGEKQEKPSLERAFKILQNHAEVLEALTRNIESQTAINHELVDAIVHLEVRIQRLENPSLRAER